jgi:hypothetical protein
LTLLSLRQTAIFHPIQQNPATLFSLHSHLRGAPQLFCGEAAREAL